METAKIKDTHLEITSNSEFLFAAKGIKSYSAFQIRDVEMVAVGALTYTSLKDLLPASSPTAAQAAQGGVLSPTYSQSSWNEIPIKNPLVKHAAWAYLQPMLAPPESDDRSFFAKLREKCSGECCGGLGCIGFLNAVVFVAIKKAFWRVFSVQRIIAESVKEDDDGDEEDVVDF